MHIYFTWQGRVLQVVNPSGASLAHWWRQRWLGSTSSHQPAWPRGSGQMRIGGRPVLVPFLATAAALATIVGTAVGMLAAPGGVQADQPGTAPTPVATAVTPMVATVIPLQDVVTPITGMAEATTSSAQQMGSETERSGNPFGGVRGGFIGAAIALGVVVLALVAVRGARALVKQRYQ